MPSRSKASAGTDEVALLAEASAALLSDLHVSSVLTKIVGSARRLIRAGAYAVWMKGDAGEWHIVASEGLSKSYTKSMQSGTRGQAAGNPVIISDVYSAPLVEDRRKVYKAEGIASLLAVPLKIHSEADGTITFYYRERHEFSERDVQSATALANLAAAALRTAELYERQERERRRSEFLVRASEVLASSLDLDETLSQGRTAGGSRHRRLVFGPHIRRRQAPARCGGAQRSQEACAG
jgi:GAF domain-containing protein